MESADRPRPPGRRRLWAGLLGEGLDETGIYLLLNGVLSKPGPLGDGPLGDGICYIVYSLWYINVRISSSG